jgi:hypothetical protein
LCQLHINITNEAGSGTNTGTKTEHRGKTMAYTSATHKITIKKQGIERGMTVNMHRNQMDDFYKWASDNGFDVELERLQPVDSAFAIDSAKFLFNLND